MEPNKYTYTPLSAEQIRVLRLPPRSLQAITPLLCKLEVIDPSRCEYEALSYCWGVAKKQKFTSIRLDGELFSVSEDLNHALSTLCIPDESRAVWVDAICINQGDVEEKGVQVSKMRDTYSLAQRTIVWVGEAKDGTETAFEQTKKLFFAASDEERREIWSHKGPWIACLNEIIERPYWVRAWTVQEVVLSADSILYCGPFWVPFFRLAHVLLHSETKNHLKVTYNIYSYLKTVLEMRAPDWRDPELGLFALTYRFRLRSLTHVLDRVYAFRGLLKSQDLLKGEAAAVDYKQDEHQLWMTLAKETMVEHQTLLPLVLAERSWPWIAEPSLWYVNFGMTPDEPNSQGNVRELFWSGGLDDPAYYPLQVNRFSAAGLSKAQVQADDKLPSVISVRGFVCDEIVAAGKAVTEFGVHFGRTNYVKLLKHWESLVGGPWADNPTKATVTKREPFSAAEIFALTITGGVWTHAPLDWRHWNTRNYSQQLGSPAFFRAYGAYLRSTAEQSMGYNGDRHPMYSARSNVDNPEYEKLRDDACEGRRMVLLKSGRFGLASESAKVGDKLAVLLGCDVPMVLRMRDYTKGHRRVLDFDNKRKLYGNTWKLRGQAYVHELMHYRGDIDGDIASGQVRLETFLLD